MAQFDWVSFGSGAVIGGVAAFATGFLKKAGEHAYEFVREKFFPEPLGPIEIDRKYAPSLFKLGSCSWVPEVDLDEFESKGHTHYPHPSGAPRCYRATMTGHGPVKEFLMVKPGAEKAA